MDSDLKLFNYILFIVFSRKNEIIPIRLHFDQFHNAYSDKTIKIIKVAANFRLYFCRNIPETTVSVLKFYLLAAFV